MAERPGGASKPHELAASRPSEPQSEQGEAQPRRLDGLVTKVDDEIEERLRAMQSEQGPKEDTSTDLRFVARPGMTGRFAAGVTGEMIPPAPIPPTLGAALRQAIRFAGGELPLWAVIAPAFVAMAIVISLAAAAATAREVIVPAPLASPSADASALASAAPAPSAVAPAPAPAPSPADTENAESKPAPKPLTLIDRAARGDGDALKTLESKPAAELSVEEALALAAGRTERDLGKARALREKLADDPALIKNASTLAELYGYTQDPTTAREALAAIARLPGPSGADMLYEVWAGTPTKTETTELARALLLGKTIRSQASPALSAALDLRVAEKCEDALAILPRVIQEGDKRSFTTLTKMQRKSGCGANKRLDCYPCLRKGTELKDALKAIKTRREPQPFRG